MLIVGPRTGSPTPATPAATALVIVTPDDVPLSTDC
jgi:hypothetical protein